GGVFFVREQRAYFVARGAVEQVEQLGAIFGRGFLDEIGGVIWRGERRPDAALAFGERGGPDHLVAPRECGGALGGLFARVVREGGVRWTGEREGQGVNRGWAWGGFSVDIWLSARFRGDPGRGT